MKKNLLPLVLGLAFLSPTVSADNLRLKLDNLPPNSGGGGENMKKLVEYLKNLGAWLGYDLDKKPDEKASFTEIIDLDTRETSLLTLVNSWLGAIPGSSPKANGSYIPGNMNLKITPSLNELANSTFSSPAYNATSEGNNITVNPRIDQKNYQLDPVSQSILNILTTPDMSYCMNDAGQWLPKSGSDRSEGDCSYLYQGQIVSNVIGDYPGEFFNSDYNQSLVPQLNSNSLLAPLLYSYEKTQSSSTESTGNPGLKADNQAQQAANFVRYAIADVLPLPLANKKKYNDLLIKATNAYKNTPFTDQKNAQNILGNYLTGLRVYAAQRSVAFGNLYSILSRRMAQISQVKSDPTPSSEALSEFTMAAWRLKDINDQTGKTPNETWLRQINKASSATVQKEIAVLLAEINYQMYLSRQQQERLLLTNTMILMQNMKENTPSLVKSTVEAASIAETVVK